MLRPIVASVCLCLFCGSLSAQPAAHVWELQEIELRAARQYANPYAEVVCWVDLKGPGFSGRVHGFWDGGDIFRVRVVATAPGEWSWTSGSNQPADSGLNGKTGAFTAQDWAQQEKRLNPNRRGFLRSSANGHALEYADGTPFLLVGDTWLGASTWRLPLTDKPADPNYEPGPGVTFQQAVALRKRQGFNSVSMIAAFPTWASDQYPGTYADQSGVFYRNAWEAFGITVRAGTPTAKAMHDERGYRPFEMVPNHEGLADFERIVPQYFQSLDRKIRLLNEEGFIPILETVRRDVCPPWKTYFDFNESYSRFVQYMVARYGAYNLILSKLHFDIYLKDYSLTAEEFREALNYHYRKYGPMPFGQPVTSLIDHSTYTTFGHGEKVPWLTLHATGNKPRDHGIYAAIETLFRLSPPYPAIDLEPHFTGWLHPNNVVGGEQPEPDSDRDNYFSRAQMYGCVLSGALAGHVHGTGAYDITTDSEPPGPRPYFWQALGYKSAAAMRWMRDFFLSEGPRYRELQLASESLLPRAAEGSSERSLDGWGFLMRTARKDLGFFYFENRALRARTAGWTPYASYRFTWYDPRTGEWQPASDLTASAQGEIQLPAFPGGRDVAGTDWAAKIVARSSAEPGFVAVEKISGHLGFFDANGSCVKEVKLGGHPHEMAFSPDGRYVYVTDNGVLWMTEGGQGGNTVSVVDTKTRTKVGVIDLGKYRRPHGIDVDPQTGNILVTTELPSALLVLDPRTRTLLRHYAVHGEAPHMVLLGPDRRWAYVSNTNTNSLAAVDLASDEVKAIPVGQRPQGTAFSPDFKRLYVANSGGDSITVIDTGSQSRIARIHTGRGPVRLAVTPDGNTVIYALQAGQAVGFANTKTLQEEKQIPLPGQPVSLTLSADQRSAFSSVQAQDKIFVISIADRKIERVITAPAASGPDPFRPLR
jgi:YVTN family beta-propeller protein